MLCYVIYLSHACLCSLQQVRVVHLFFHVAVHECVLMDTQRFRDLNWERLISVFIRLVFAELKEIFPD